MSEINYQALREAAERAIPAMERLLMLPVDDDLLSEQELKDYGVDIDALNAFKFLTGPETVLALLDERERNQQYIKRRDQENEEIALTVGKLRVELEAANERIAELEALKTPRLTHTAVNECTISVSAEAIRACMEEFPESVQDIVEECASIAENACRAAMIQGKSEQPQNAQQNIPENIPGGNSPVTPDGWVIVPKKLTAENGAKGVLSGEFSETTFISCPECFGDDDCDTCDGSGRIEIKVPVTWTTIKSIWDKGIAHFAAKPPQEVNRG
ncbi:ead/Ea22-like family protein [Escherichia coli]|nr:ead/Ea22-like family protein [Escherichia coli]